MTQQTATSISQSKRLTKAGVDRKTADLVWIEDNPPRLTLRTEIIEDENPYMDAHAWSLSALLALLPRTILGSDCKDEQYENDLIIYPRKRGRTWTFEYSNNDDDIYYQHMAVTDPSLIEACVLMIERLLDRGYELNILKTTDKTNPQ